MRRWNPTTFLNVYWVVIPHYETGWSSRFGDLTGLPQLGSPRRVEVTPYVRAGATLPDSRLREQGAERQVDYRAGADIEVGLAPNLALNATLNPDFGQVEADPAQVNLTQFETFFPEKRPFFLEGRQLFHARGPTWFYSRRVGSVPPGTRPAGGLEDPREASILGAAKLTGRLPSGLSVGGLAAVTERERVGLAGFDTAPDSTPLTAAVAPTTAFVVGRVHQEVGESGSGIGFSLTGVDRFFTGESDLERLLTRTAVAGGTDWNVRFGEGRYEVEGFAGLSHVAGDEDAILRQQLSSARYYQRPDADHVALDSAATSLTGYTGGLSVAKTGGAHLFWRAGVSAASPGFEIRDAGSQTRGDRVDTHASVRYGQRGNPGAIHTYSVGAAVNSGWNFGGTRRYTMPSLFADITWRSLIRSFVQVDLSTRALSDDLTRGGPLMGTALGGGAQVNLASSPVPTTQWYANGRTFFDEFGGWSASVDGGVSLRPSQRLGLSFGPGLTRSLDSRQYFGTFDGESTQTFGNRYVFAYLSRTELFAQLRMDYAVTPELTVELYAEPFASSGDFQRFGELEEAGGSEVREYGADGASSVTEAEDGTVTVTDGADQFQLFNSDFRVRSFRSNAVVRWEWAPGSTFHLIWQQSRFQFDESGTPPGPGSLFRTFGDPGESILVAKLSYWFSF